MAYAYIKYLDGINQGKTEKVKASEITPSIANLQFNTSKKYLLKNTKIQVLHTAGRCTAEYLCQYYYIN